MAIALIPCSGRPGMAGQSEDVHDHPVAAGGADREFRRRAAVKVEGQTGISQERLAEMPSALQTDFLLDEPTECQGWMGQTPLDDLQRRVQQHGTAGPVIGSEPRARIGRADLPSDADRPATNAHRDRVHMSREEPARRPLRAAEFQDEVADFSAQDRTAMRGVGAEAGRRNARLTQPVADELRDFPFLAALAGYRH